MLDASGFFAAQLKCAAYDHAAHAPFMTSAARKTECVRQIRIARTHAPHRPRAHRSLHTTPRKASAHCGSPRAVAMSNTDRDF